MLDIKFIRENLELVRASAVKKHMEIDFDRLLELDESRRAAIGEVEGIRATKNEWSKKIPKLQGDEKKQAIATMKEAGAREKELSTQLKEVEASFEELMLLVPNVCAPDVPEGKDDAENVELRTWGTRPEFDFEWKDHVALGEALDIIDIPRGVKLAGTRSYILKGDGARLELAVLNAALEFISERGFTPMLVPHIVRAEPMVGTAYYPGGEEQSYQCEKDELSLIGTSEVPITSYHMNETLDQSELPRRYAGMSACYRREAGTYGKDTKGLYRIHQFSKVEQVVVCEADEEVSKAFHQEILANAEAFVQSLELPYRVVYVCGGDLGRPHVAKYDIECWMPSRESWGETHSASRFYDFQSRRLGLRYRGADGKTRLAHTLNNTVIASPRILIPLLEIHQQADGSVRIPEPLRKWMGGRDTIGPPSAAS